jgi:5-methylcytosine-specific restriction enzyme subunit McrC
MREIDLYEWVTKPDVPLDPEEVAVLRRYVPTVRISPVADKPECYDLTPDQHIGAVTVGDLSIVIRPKLHIERVLFLISHAIGSPDVVWPPIDLGGRANLVEAIVPGFVHQVRTVLRRGLLQGYRPTDESLLTVRGRIRVADQMRRRLSFVPPVEVSYDEYTEDILPNRLLRAAVARLRRLPLRRPETRRALRSIDAALDNVTVVEYRRTEVPIIRYDRLSEHYRPAVELARLILASLSYELIRGGTRTMGFLVDMNDIFEGFVINTLRDRLDLSDKTFPRGAKGHRLTLDDDTRIALKPDLSWWRGNTCRFVGDVKYKKTYDRAVPNADLYQVLAYAVATDLSGGLLVYAAGEDEPWRYRVRHVGKAINVTTLDLAGTEVELMGSIDRLAAEVRRLANLRPAVLGPELAPSGSSRVTPVPTGWAISPTGYEASRNA